MSDILIADDSPPIRLLLKRRLEMAGHHVLEAGDGCEALAILEGPSNGDVVEVVILDAAMPKMTGAEAMREIRTRWPGMPVIGLSASLDLGESEEWDAAADFIGKPIDFDRLLGRIEELTSGPPRP
jgi:DNA-binding response OmpR family regulator